MKKHYEFDQLDAQEFKNRVQNNFSPALLTLLSIIQGVAFYFLINNMVIEFILKKDFLSPFLFYPFFSFASIIIVFYMYSYFVSITYRPPNFREAVVPFALGLTEILPTQFFRQPRLWWFFFGIFCIFGALGFLNTSFGMHKDDFKEKYLSAYTKTRVEMKKDVYLAVAIAVISFLTAYQYPAYTEGAMVNFGVHDWFPLSLLGLLMFTIILTTEVYLHSLYRIFKLLRDKNDIRGDKKSA